MNMPRIRVELEHIRQTMTVAIAQHTDEIKALVTETLATALAPETVVRIVKEELAVQLRSEINRMVLEAIRGSVSTAVYERVELAAVEAARDVLQRMRKASEDKGTEQ